MQGRVADTHFHVTQVRGFEKFTEGRPFYEMPSITARICGICPVSHLLASAKACDAIMAVTPPPAGRKLRELIHCAQFVQSHALSFFHLSAPDLLLGFDSRPRPPQHLRPDRSASRDGARRRRAAQVRPADHRGPGRGARAPLVDRARRRQCAARAGDPRPHPRRPAGGAGHRRARRSSSSRPCSTASPKRSPISAPRPPCTPGWWMTAAASQWYDGLLTFKDADGAIVAADIRARDYADFIGEASLRDSYLKAPYYKPMGYPAGRLPRGPAGAPERGRIVRHAGGRPRTGGVPPALRRSSPTARSTTTTRG